jgi:hypothetical protein
MEAPPAHGRGAVQSAFGFAFGTLRHLRTLLTLRLSKGLVRLGDLLLPAWHIGFDLVTGRGFSGRWHFDLLGVSNGHNVKHRPRIVRNQDERLFPSRRYACPLARPLHRTCFWKRQIDVNQTLPFEEGAAVERRGGRRGHQQGMVDFERLSKFWVAESYRVAAAKHFLRIL